MSCLSMLATVILCEYLVSSAALAWTPRQSTWRQVSIVSLILLAIPEIRLLSFLPGPELLRGVVAFSCLIKLVHFSSLFLVLQVEIHQLVAHPASASSLTRLGAALNCVTSTRGIGTPWEVKKTGPSCRESSHKTPPYLVKSLLALVWQYMAIDLLSFGAVKYVHREWPGALATGAEFLGPGSTREQLLARIPLCCILVANLRLLFAMVYGALATISVLLGLTAPQDWPPLFGSVRHLQTFCIRSFWATYWHQLLRWPLLTISRDIRRRLRFRCTGSSSRQAQNVVDLFLVFSLSGVFHVLSAAYAGVPGLGAIYLFFLANSVVITVETVYRARLDGSERPGRMNWPGFLWKLTWPYVCLPWFAYPALRLPVKKNAVMPFSFVEEFGSPAVLGMLAAGGIVWRFIGGETF
ncbi:hypothetical protein FE257_005598 [Aspergillus nanangensis]|uniref:Wax synthase domain-containing protein n=1 Tax=Aspergillus nanangensis TaxID=2582783 RepID=A0AAD4CS65_ASPNN|nr:hypothetical protein FE257_005598 [Aspergillus nanangensis]